jgi:hypothetical protein
MEQRERTIPMRRSEPQTLLRLRGLVVPFVWSGQAAPAPEQNHSHQEQFQMPTKTNDPNRPILDSIDAVIALARDAGKLTDVISALLPTLPAGADHATLHRLMVASSDFCFAIEHSKQQVAELRSRLGKHSRPS